MGRPSRVRRGVYWAVFALIVMASLFPCWLMIINSFSTLRAFIRTPPSLIPSDFTLAHYQRIFSLPLLPRWILNTALLLVVHIVAGVSVNGAAGYVFAFCRGRWAKILFWLMMVPIFVSGYVMIIPQFLIVGKLGMSGMMAVISMSIFWPTGIYLFRNYFRTIPQSVMESARLDGAEEWTILARIVLPLSKPIFGTAVVFLGMGSLGSYLWPMLNLHIPKTQTYLVGLMAAGMDYYVVKNIGFHLAVGTMIFLPYLALFAFSSKYFIGGLTGGAMKE